MFKTMYECDKCHKLFPASDQATTQLSISKRDDNVPIRYDLCNVCLNDVIIYITTSGGGITCVEEDIDTDFN